MGKPEWDLRDQTNVVIMVYQALPILVHNCLPPLDTPRGSKSLELLQLVWKEANFFGGESYSWDQELGLK